MRKIALLAVLAVLCFAVHGFAQDIQDIKDSSKRQFRTLSTVNTLQAKQFKPVTAIRIKTPLKLKGVLRPIVPSPAVKPAGPDPQAAVDLADMIDDPDLLEDLGTACGWDPHLIFQDKKAGNVFYYLPRGFLLKYDESSGYGLNVQYNHLQEGEGPSVMLTAELAAPHQKGDIQLLKQILKQAFEMKASDKLVLKSISGIGAAADIQSIAAGLSIASENITLTMPSSLKKPFRLVISLTPDEAEEVLAQVSREGLSGNLNVKVGEADVPIPILLRYMDFSGTRVDGFGQWVADTPTGRLHNISRFPVTLDSINGYRIKNGSLERISKRLKASTILPGRNKNFKLPPAGKVLGGDVILAWLGTSLGSDCTDCIKGIDRQVRKGVASAPSTRLKFEAIPSVFADFELYKMIVAVKSPYFSPEPGTPVVQEIELTEEENTHNSLVIYVPQGKGDKALLYRYRIQLIDAEGRTFQQDAWTDGRSAHRFLGASQIEPIMPESVSDNDAGEDE